MDMVDPSKKEVKTKYVTIAQIVEMFTLPLSKCTEE
jgi:hypothetical protein